MERRSFLGALGAAPAVTARPQPASSSRLPRKVVVGTVMQGFWVEHPGVTRRLAELCAIVDDMQAAAKRKYGRGVDLAILSECVVTGEAGPGSRLRAVPLRGEFSDAFGAKARELGCYIVAPTYLREPDDSISNAAVLFGRKGEVAGIYRKVHLVVPPGTREFENGCRPGGEVPVFDCDFGKLGIQICYDMEFDYGWDELARQGAELVAFPTQSPQTSHPASRAMRGRYYIVSSTWRSNATVFEPTGKIPAQVLPPGRILVHELDLSYAILPWTANLKNGEALRAKFGDKVGYRYYHEEDCGIFWSNDPHMTVAEMAKSVGAPEAEAFLDYVRGVYRGARVTGYR
ncbi:MAG: carbon-nitrogen hydrolase family protein [Acidobacteria bacterium]|nr:carbon-nitrogen hydrolase family protein [Acidobacteriota bacterium]